MGSKGQLTGYREGVRGTDLTQCTKKPIAVQPGRLQDYRQDLQRGVAEMVGLALVTRGRKPQLAADVVDRT